MNKYQILTNILDKLREEAITTHPQKYFINSTDIEQINQGRSRAFIHLFLKVGFGILEFNKREHFVTDGSYDGGIDGYYINNENKTIYLIQSKFRTNERNFVSKEISLDEILLMDINRILENEEFDENGNRYNGKINQLQREIRNTENIARYSYKIIFLANLSNIPDTKIRQLTGGYSAEIYDHEKCYEKLIFPIIAGTFFNASDLNINIDLSNKNAGSKISYTVQTKKGECEITVLFVPTIEISKLMYKYKNSILKFNPRSYLDLEGKKVNNAIRDTILNTKTNEFALFNNGITMLSDETFINERIGQKNKAQLLVKNPQIINGGQTSYTLSLIFQENLNNNVEEIFLGKEVLLKVITLLDKNDDESKVELIEEISTATNQQTPVINADRISNDKIHLILQKLLFHRFGILYERKRGEFGDGVHNLYIDKTQILERNLFFRMYYAANGKIKKAMQKKLFLKQDFTEITLKNKIAIDNFYFGFLCFRNIYKVKHVNQKIDMSIYAKVCALTLLYKPENIQEYDFSITSNLEIFEKNWLGFIDFSSKKGKYQKLKKDKRTGGFKTISGFNRSAWYDSQDFEKDLLEYYNEILPTTHSTPTAADA